MRFLLVVAVLAAGAGMLGRDAYTELFEPLPLQQAVTVEFEKGDSLTHLLKAWQAAGYLSSTRQRWYVQVYARFTGQSHLLKAGEYELAPGMRAVDLTALLVSGKVKLHELRFVEGMRFDEAVKAVLADPSIRKTLADSSPATVMAALHHPDVPPEGRLFPDTYRFPKGTTDVAFLQRAYDLMDEVLTAEWKARDEGLPLEQPGQALTLASIVEKETGVEAERPHIAGVFLRRLKRGMLLQTDPTVIYGLGPAFDGNLRRRDLEHDTPYNTYLRRGLPPTPICLPGRAALHAALHPLEGDTLYFVSRGDGSHFFSATLAEHTAAVRKYQLKKK